MRQGWQRCASWRQARLAFKRCEGPPSQRSVLPSVPATRSDMLRVDRGAFAANAVRRHPRPTPCHRAALRAARLARPRTLGGHPIALRVLHGRRRACTRLSRGQRSLSSHLVSLARRRCAESLQGTSEPGEKSWGRNRPGPRQTRRVICLQAKVCRSPTRLHSRVCLVESRHSDIGRRLLWRALWRRAVAA